MRKGVREFYQFGFCRFLMPCAIFNWLHKDILSPSPFQQQNEQNQCLKLLSAVLIETAKINAGLTIKFYLSLAMVLIYRT